MDQLSVAVCQLTSVDDIAQNTRQIFARLRSFETTPPDLICFPENAMFLRVKEGDSIPALSLQSTEIQSLSQWSVRFGSVIHLGSVPMRFGGEKLYNTSVVLRPDGQIESEYRKIHLFDVDVEGVKPLRESDVFNAGLEPHIFVVKGWKIGSTICYDLRFSELFLHYAQNEVDALLVPSSFLVPTGRAHWEVLVRARAIECQAYVLAAAQGGEHPGISGGKRLTYGHSLIVDPWGTVLGEVADTLTSEPILRSLLTKSQIRKVRMQIPMRNRSKKPK